MLKEAIKNIAKEGIKRIIGYKEADKSEFWHTVRRVSEYIEETEKSKKKK